MVTHIGASKATFEVSVNTRTRRGKKRRKKRGAKTKGAPPRAPTKPKEGEARTRAPQGGKKEEPFRCKP